MCAAAVEPIAIIGTGCRFPGGASAPSKLWDLLREPRDLLEPLHDRFSVEGWHHSDGKHHGHCNVKDSYQLDGKGIHRLFDAQFFGINAIEANTIDPQMRLLLETVYEALECAGQPMENLRGSDTAVYTGQLKYADKITQMMFNSYRDGMERDLNNIGTYHVSGTSRAMVSNRLSYFFDWHGPSITIDTACSSSTIAVHQAVQQLRSRQSRVAIAAGSNLILDPSDYIAMSKLEMLSHDSRSRMWDKDANGYARGEGVAAVVLKTLSAAEADGDHIECVIRETATNHDGRTPGITMPSAAAQTQLIRDCYARAGLDAADPTQRPQYFEAHGTGTPAGDPVEAEAIKTAFFPDEENDDDQQLFVGSVKTVIGHSESVAGLAGLIKTSLALQNATVPPNLLFRQVNPEVGRFCRNLQIPTSANPWPTVGNGCPRRASVNSFGFGGANGHVILESYTPPKTTATSKQKIPDPSHQTPCFIPFVFSAASDTSLSANLDSVCNYLSADGGAHVNLRDLALTLHSRRSRLPFGTTVTASTVQELREKMEQKCGNTASTRPLIQKSDDLSRKPKILGVFTGQGAQSARMGASFIEQSPACQAIIDKLEAQLGRLPQADRPSWSLKHELLRKDTDDGDFSTSGRVSQATLSQPLCTALQIMQVDLLRAADVHFLAVVGHSSGEIGAAYCAGLISAEDAICIAYYRGLCAERLAKGPTGKKGVMLAVGTSFEDAKELCEDSEFQGRVGIAAVNSSVSVTLSGDTDAIDEIMTVFEDEGKFVRRLRADKAYHSPHMAPCSGAYLDALRGLDIQLREANATTSWFSSVYGGKLMSHEEEKEETGLRDTYWNDNMTRPVLFQQAIKGAWKSQGPFHLIIEIGPHPALKGPALQTIQELAGQEIPYTGLHKRGQNAVATFTDALGYIWTHLGTVNLPVYDTFVGGCASGFHVVKGLPPYVWDHDKEYWHESRQAHAIRTRSDPAHELLGHLTPDSNNQDMRWRNILSPRELPWLKGHALQQQPVFPAAGYVVAALEASAVMAKGKEDNICLIEVLDLDIEKALAFDSDYARIETICALTDIRHGGGDGGKRIEASFKFNAAPAMKTDSLALLASGRVRVRLGAEDEFVLPPRSSPELGLFYINEGALYASLEALDYQFTGPFRALHGLQRKHGYATGYITNAMTSEEDQSRFMVHPTVLDAAFQSLLVAHCAPGSGALWSLHVPKKIRAVRVNPLVCANNNDVKRNETAVNGTGTISFDCIQPEDSLELRGDVDLFASGTSGKQAAMVQVEGLLCVPFTRAKEKDDKVMFSTVVWDVEKPDAERVIHDGERCLSEDKRQLASLLERMSVFYLRKLDRDVPRDHPARFQGSYEYYFRFASHILARFELDESTLWFKAWLHDTAESLALAYEPYLHIIDVKLLKSIGENIVDIATGLTQAIGVGIKDGMLSQMYQYGLGMPEHTTWLARLIRQITHRHPHMHILEIGAGTGSATREILGEIGQTFSSYTYTDISSGFFEAAQHMLATLKLDNKMVHYKVLDISKDVRHQGYKEHAYDLVVASAVLHATPNLRETLENARRLLRPGGFLVALEVLPSAIARVGTLFGALPGWWLGAKDGRDLSPCIDLTAWDGLLRATGFSGCDTVAQASDSQMTPLAVFVSQAVDARVEFLRDPLFAHTSLFDTHDDKNIEVAGMHELVLFGGVTLQTSKVVVQLKSLLRRHWGANGGSSIKTAPSITDLASLDITQNTTVLSLAEMEGPVFKDLKDSGWETLKRLLQGAGTVLWATKGRRAESPYANIMIGLLRSAREEITTLDVQCLDFEGKDPPDAQELAEALLRWKAVIMWKRVKKGERNNDMLVTAEPELVRERGSSTLMIPRLIANRQMNDRYNSSRRPIFTSLNKSVNDHVGRVQSDNATNLGLMELGDQKHLSLHKLSMPEGCQVIQVTRSLRLALRVSGPGCGFMHLVLGRFSKSSDSRAVVALTNQHALLVNPLDGLSTTAFVSAGEEALFLALLAYHLLATVFLESLSNGVTVVVYGPLDTAFAAVLEDEAKQRNVRVVFITSTIPASEAGSGWLTIHPMAPERAIRALLPPNTAALLDLGPKDDDEASSESVGSRLRSQLSSHCGYHSLDSIFKAVCPPDWEPQPMEIPGLAERLKSGIRLTESRLMANFPRPNAVEVVSLNELSQLHVQDGLLKKNVAISVIDWSSHASPDLLVRVQPVDSQLRFSMAKTYWLAGLSGGLGLLLCEWMVRHGARHIVISSRKPRIPEPWLQNMHAAGVVVKIFACDVTNKSMVSDLYSNIQSTLPPLAGVCQGAMVLRDTAFRDMSLAALLEVMRPKVEGSLNLDQVLEEAQVTDLEFFIFFSSASSIIGRPGQSNYAAANLFMTALAEQRRRRGRAASVMHIGPILGVGYITQQGIEDVFRRNVNNAQGAFSPISEQDFCYHFAEAVLAGRSRSSSCQPNSSPVLEVTTGLSNFTFSDELSNGNPFLSHYYHDIQDGTRMVSAAEDRSKAPLETRLAAARDLSQLADVIRSALLLKISVLFQTDLGKLEQADLRTLRLDEMGIDSLIAFEVRGWFVQTLQVNIPVLRIMSGSSVADLIDAAVNMVPKSLVPLLDDKGVGEPDGLEGVKVNGAALNQTMTSTAVTFNASDTEAGNGERLKPKIEKANGITANHPSSSESNRGDSLKDTHTPNTPFEDQDLDKDEKGQLFKRPEVSTPTPDDHNDEKLLDLSYSQSLFWFSAAFSDDPSNLNLTAAFRLTGEIDIEGLKRAVMSLGQQHEALRTRFIVGDDGKPMQAIMKSTALRLEHYNIGSESELAVYTNEMHNHAYDLESGKTMRMALVSKPTFTHTPSQQAYDHFFLVGIHHLTMDGQSLPPLMRDLLQHYTHGGKMKTMTTKQYGDFSAAQHSNHASGGLDADLAFWRAELAGPNKMPPPLPILRMSPLSSRPPLRGYRNLYADARLSRTVKSAIHNVCRRSRTTPFHFLLTVFRVLLWRYAGTTDFAVGVGDANRTTDDMMGSIGSFVNMLPLVFAGTGVDMAALCFDDVLLETRSKMLAALEHSRVPFQLLLHELGVPRSATSTPIFQAFIDYRLGYSEKMSWGDCELELVSFQRSKLAYDVSVDIIDNSDGDCSLTFIFRDDLYNQADVEQFASSYVLLATAFATQPGAILGETDVFSQSDINAALNLGRGPLYQPSPSWGDSIIHRIDDIAKMHSEKTAVIAVDGSVASYDDVICKRVDAIATQLQSIGITAGSRVAVLQEPTPDWIASILAVMRLGAAYLPLDVGTPYARLAAIVKDCQPQAIMVDVVTIGNVYRLDYNARIVNTARCHDDRARSHLEESSPRNRPSIEVTPDTVSTILYTSGSSGTPKGIVLTHRGIQAWLEPCGMLYDINHSGDHQVVVLQQSSQGFDMSLMQILTALCFGGSLCLLPHLLRGDAQAITQTMIRHGVTHTYGTPSEYLGWLRHSGKDNLEALRTSPWRTALVGGENLTTSVLSKFAAVDKGDLRFYHMYGTTESTFCAAVMELDYLKEVAAAATAVTEASSLKKEARQRQQPNYPAGVALPNYNIYILDEQRRPLRPHMRGEIYIGGAGVAKGYLNNSLLTAETFVPDSFATADNQAKGWNMMQRTGDVGRWSRIDDGSAAILVEGRISGDTMVKLRGLRIDLREVEVAIVHAGANMVSEAVVSVRQGSPESQEFLVAHVVLKNKSGAVTNTMEIGGGGGDGGHKRKNTLSQTHQEELRGRLLHLPLYMRPAFIIPLDALPLTSSGKLDRRAIGMLPLPKADDDIAGINGHKNEISWNPTEEKLKDIWDIVLQSSTSHTVITPDTDFFHVGGSSLSLLGLLDHIKAQFGVQLELVDLFDASVLSQMAHRIQGQTNALDSINWEEETRLQPALAEMDSITLQQVSNSSSKIVILTGGSGYLGKALVYAMLRDPTIKEIHCIGVRNAESRTELRGLAKVILYEGDLMQPRIGLSQAIIDDLFSQAHVIIHNGADVSYIKTYRSMRQSNFTTTKDLIAWAAPRMIPFHFISTAGIGNLFPEEKENLGEIVLRETSMASTPPPIDGSAGYTACKWASEVYLERLVERHPRWPICVHRPTLISRDHDNVPTLDGVHNLLGYSRRLGAVPAMQGVAHGVFNVVHVDDLVSGVLDCALRPHDRGGCVHFVNHVGALNLPLDDMRRWALDRRADGHVELAHDVELEEIAMDEWIQRASALGMHPTFGAMLSTFARNGKVRFPAVVKG